MLHVLRDDERAEHRQLVLRRRRHTQTSSRDDCLLLRLLRYYSFASYVYFCTLLGRYIGQDKRTGATATSVAVWTDTSGTAGVEALGG